MKIFSVKSVPESVGADETMEASGKRTGIVFLAVFLLLAAGIVAAGLFYYRGLVKEHAGRQLSSIADLNVSQLAQWRNEQLWQVVVMVVALLFGLGGGCLGLLWWRQVLRVYRGQTTSAEALREITDRKLALEEASRMATVVRDSNDAITIQDFAGRITAWNHGAEFIYGYSEAEALQMNIERLTAPSKIEEQKDFVRRLFAGEAVTSLETQRVTKDGRVLDVWMAVTKLVDDAGKPIGIASTERDITDRKLALEEASRMATQLEAANKDLEAFSYSVSHDLRAPLRAINGYGRILVEDYAERLDDEGRRVLDVISSETRRMGQLIDDLLTFSRLGRQKLEMSEINMTALAQAVFEEQLAQAPERNLQVDLKPMAPAYGDRAMLRVVFTNLISNAIKFTKHRDPAQIEIGSLKEDGQIVYYVKDNGAGFDMKYASKLFGVFQRLHSIEEFEGTGVGLALIQRVIRHHGGRIWPEAKVNEGATFTFALPNKKGK